MNKLIIIGRLGMDPQVKQTEKTTVAKFSVATEIGRGKDNKQTSWVNCVCFGKLAEIVDKYVFQGTQVYCEGELKNSSYKNKEGKKIYTSDLIVRNLQMFGGPNNRDNEAQDFGHDYEEIPL